MAIHPLPYTFLNIDPSPAFPNGRVAPRPILQVTLRNNEKYLTCYAIIDSGADHCAFPRSFMQPLGLDPLACPTETTIGVASTTLPTHFAPVTLDMQGVVQFPVYAGFTVGLETMGVGLLGQIGFFDRFNIGFSLADKKCCYIDVPETNDKSRQREQT